MPTYLRPLFRLILLLCCVLFVLMLLIVAAARRPSAQLTNAQLQGFRDGCADKSTICWQGLTPGLSTVEDVSQYLLGLGYQNGSTTEALNYQYFYSQTLVPGCIKTGHPTGRSLLIYLRLYCLGRLTLGQVVAALGAPQSIVYLKSPYGDSEFLSYGDQYTGLSLVAGGGWQSLQTPISSLEMYDPGPAAQVREVIWPWHGFVSIRRYCTLVPAYPRCTQIRFR